MSTKFWSKNQKGRDHLQDIGVNGKIILVWILEKWSGNGYKKTKCFRRT